MKLSRSGWMLIVGLLLLVAAVAVAAGEIKHTFVATDESGRQLLYVDETNPANDWTVPLPGNRDIQLSGKGTVLVSVPVGYREYALKTGELLKEIKVGQGIQTLVRVDSGHTFLASKTAVIELDENDAVVGRHEIMMGGYFRLLRLARNGNLLFTSGKTTVKELKLSGSTVRELDLTSLTPESMKPYFMEETSDGRFFMGLSGFPKRVSYDSIMN